jgi:hypothetical protein
MKNLFNAVCFTIIVIFIFATPVLILVLLRDGFTITVRHEFPQPIPPSLDRFLRQYDGVGEDGDSRRRELKGGQEKTQPSVPSVNGANKSAWVPKVFTGDELKTYSRENGNSALNLSTMWWSSVRETPL